MATTVSMRAPAGSYLTQVQINGVNYTPDANGDVDVPFAQQAEMLAAGWTYAAQSIGTLTVDSIVAAEIAALTLAATAMTGNTDFSTGSLSVGTLSSTVFETGTCTATTYVGLP